MSRVRKLQNRKSNPNLIRLIDELLDGNAKNDAPIWKDVAKRLVNPRRNHAEVNISKIHKNSGDNEVILVPGKVLGGGELSKVLSVAAISFSETARRKIEGSGGKCLTIRELMEQNPSGSGVKIIV
ncbi:MAG: 50S ribosomal protein L18e [Archaeoglobaceae archaeon]